MQKIPRIHKIISGKHVVWFGESNQWIGFELPAYEVYSKYEEGADKPEISNFISKQYELPGKEADRFVDEIISGIQSAQKNTKSAQGIDTPQKAPGQTEFYSKRQYLINDQCFEIRYGSKLMEYYIHPPLAHLEVETAAQTDVCMTILEHQDRYYLNSGEQDSYWETNDFALLKRRFYIEILNRIYMANSSDWFSRIHASAITDNEQAILLSSESGSGKSTLAALMQTRGYRVLSDDFVPMHSKDLLAYPVPAALSLKKGSFDVISQYLKDFDPKAMDKYEFGHKDVRFLPPAEGDKSYTPVPSKAIVFIKYLSSISETSFSEISAFEALSRYHQEAWVDETAENAQTFIDWFEKLSFYQLEYSDTNEAMDRLSTLFDLGR